MTDPLNFPTEDPRADDTSNGAHATLPNELSDVEADSIPAFCRRYNIGRTTLYKAWAEGWGPPSVKIGRRKIVPRDEGKEWFRRLVAEQNSA